MANLNLLQVDFHGFGPINNYTFTASLLINRGYRAKHRDQVNPGYAIGSIRQKIDETTEPGKEIIIELT